MTFNLNATNEDFKIVTKGGGTVVVPSSSTSAYLALSGNYLTAETEPAFAAMSAFLSNSISSKVMIQDGVNGTKTYKDLSVIAVNNSNLSDYANALKNDELDEDALYVLNLSALNAFGQKIEKVGYPTISSDAANKQYVDDAVSGIQIPTDLSDLSNGPGYITSASISASLADIQKSVFQSISNPAASVRSVQETLISVLNILRG